PKRGAQPFGGVSQKCDMRHACEQLALPPNQFRMKMADNRLLDLRQPRPDGFILPKKRQRGWIMAKEQNPLFGLQRGERCPNFLKMFLTRTLPFDTLLGQAVRLE